MKGKRTNHDGRPIRSHERGLVLTRRQWALLLEAATCGNSTDLTTTQNDALDIAVAEVEWAAR